MSLLALFVVLVFLLLAGVMPLVATPLIAWSKGFKWYFWLFASSLFGLLVVAILPSANRPGLTAEEQHQRRQKGNRAGSGMAMLTVGLLVFRVVAELTGGLPGSPPEPGAGQPAESVWESSYHPIRIGYGPAWKILDGSQDADDSMQVALIDQSDGKSYMVFVTPFEPGFEVADEACFAAMRRKMLSMDEPNRLVDETDLQFHGAVFRRFRFMVNAEDSGTARCYVFVRRIDKQLIVVEWTIPCEGDAVHDDSVPVELTALDDNVLLFEGPLPSLPPSAALSRPLNFKVL